LTGWNTSHPSHKLLISAQKPITGRLPTHPGSESIAIHGDRFVEDVWISEASGFVECIVEITSGQTRE